MLASALALACGGEAEGPGSGPPPVTVEVMEVEAQTLRDVATFSGQIDAEHSVVVRPETSGMVASVHFVEGQRVVAGQVLLRLRSDEQKARLAEAQANLELARQESERARELLSRDAVSLAARDRSAAELAVTEARVALARVELDRTEIRAPFDGVAGIRLVDPGDRVDEDVALVQIDAVDRLQVTFALTEHAVLFERPGARVWIQVAPYPGELFPGDVFYISPTIEPSTRRVYMKAWVPNQDGRLRAGMFANVDLEIGRRENAILVPESAVVFDRQGSFVWRLDSEDVASRVPIDLGLRKEGRVEVTVGLRAGDRIVVSGTHKVSEGKKLIARAASTAETTGQARGEPQGSASAGQGT